MASSSGRIWFPITPFKYFLQLHVEENLSLAIEFVIIPFTTGPDTNHTIWSLANFSALATDGRGTVRETVRNMIKCRTRKFVPAMGMGDPITRQNFSNKVFSNVQEGLHQYGLELRSVQVNAETRTDIVETKPDAIEAKTDAVETETKAVETKAGAVETEPEIYGNITVERPELETDSDLVLVIRD